MRSVLSLLLFLLSFSVTAQTSVAPLDSSRTVFSIYLKDGGYYVGRIVKRDAIKVVVRRAGGELSYLAPADITRIEPFQKRIKLRGREIYNVTLTDGTVYTGEITQRDSLRVILRRRGGESILSPKEIAKIEQVLEDGQAQVASGGVPVQTAPPSRFEGNQFPWLLYNQTGIPLRQGQLTYRNIWVLYNEVSYGLLSFLSLRASITPSFQTPNFFEGTLYTRPSLGAKLSIPLGKVHVGGDISYRWTEGTEYGFFYRDRNYRERTLSGFIAFGTIQQNLTLAYTHMKRADSFINDRQSIDVGFVVPIGRRLSLVSDNRLLVGQNQYNWERFSQISGVLRLNRPRHAFDMGVLVAIRDDNQLRLYPLPYVAFNTRLSRK